MDRLFSLFFFNIWSKISLCCYLWNALTYRSLECQRKFAIVFAQPSLPREIGKRERLFTYSSVFKNWGDVLSSTAEFFSVLSLLGAAFQRADIFDSRRACFYYLAFIISYRCKSINNLEPFAPSPFLLLLLLSSDWTLVWRPSRKCPPHRVFLIPIFE